GNQYTVTQLVGVVATEQIDMLLQDLWLSMNAALIQGNQGLAVDHLYEESIQMYGDIFFVLLPEFPTIIQGYSDLQLLQIHPDHGSYLVNRNINAIDRAFIIEFVMDYYGVWRVFSM
ncbi:MAG: hypothetical protein AB2596_20755, partial [Candidatus Thiodiazotropha sp.]